MAAPKESWRRLLGGAIFFLLLPAASSVSCSNIAIDAPVVLWGGNVSASCTVWGHHCRFQEDGETRVMWKWDKEFLSGAQHSLGDGVEASNITIGPLNRTATTLSCWVQKKGTPQIMNLTQIHAGYPPSEPQNLTCVMNVTTKNLTCHWNPGQDGLLPASVTLHSVQTNKDCNIHRETIPPCIPPPGQNFCTIPRQDFQLYQYVMLWVSVENALGAVRSKSLCADPTDLVKLDPPTLRAIQSVPKETDCVIVAWDGAEGSRYMQQACELRYRAEGHQEWMRVQVPNVTPSTWQTQHCGFRFGTSYQFQLRCKRLPISYWSDWSPPKNFTTHEKGPSGKLVTWWKVRPRKADKETEVQLLWKPMRPEETNGKMLGYWVTLGTSLPPGKSSTLCNTTGLQCTLLLPPGTQRVFLVAYNSRGLSPPTEVLLLDKKGQPVSRIRASPRSEKSIRVCWDPPRAPTPMGYVIEWHRMTSVALPEDGVRWMKLGNGSITEGLIQEDIQPFQRYNISVYPLYQDRTGMPQSVEAYSLQKAPSDVPKLHAGNISKSTADLYWEPIPVEKQNGFITNYTIFWSGTNGEMSSAVVNSSMDSFTIRGLWASKMYQVHIMASTRAGSTNGTILTLYTKAMDDMDISFVYLLVGLLLLMIIVLVICFQKSKRMKTQFWPSVPDPANSSLGKWAPTILHEETPQAPKACELSPIIVSAILVIETEEKKCFSCGKSEPVKALEDSPTASRKSYSREVSTAALETGVTPPTSYVNSPESVQYAKVVGDPYRSQEEASSMFYVRSNSTQPLLGDLTPSPKPYENLWFHGKEAGRESGSGGFPEEVFLDRALLDFPLLQGLKIEGDEDLSDFRRV